MFNMELEEVPDFCNIYETEESDEWYEEFIKWLNERGFSYLPVEAKNDLNRPNYRGCYLLVTGKNSQGINHCVIYKNGEPIHNPNINCKGIEPETIDLIFPLDPALLKIKPPRRLSGVL